MTTLSAAEEEHYQRDLERDRSKPFEDEYGRTTDLERQILDDHGEAGSAFLLRREGALAGWTEGCPWPDGGGPVAERVREILRPIGALLPDFVESLVERTRWLLPVRRGETWQLAYFVDRALYDGRAYYEIIFGGAPNANPVLSERTRELGWLLPKPLRLLYSVHDGLGPADCGGIVSSAELADLGELMDPIAAEQGFRPQGYAFQDLLEFCRDGAGNAQCFHRRRREDADPPTVDWDHETREISEAMPFGEFADAKLVEALEDEE